MLHPSVLLVGLLVALCVGKPAPQVAIWSNKTYGPDGPWRAVTISIGTDKQGNPLSTVDLFPAGWIYNNVNGANFCRNSQGCAAQNAGLFDSKNSVTAYTNITAAPGLVSTLDSDIAHKGEGGSATIMLDTIRINTTGSNPIVIQNSSTDVMQGKQITWPDGTTYTPSVGFLALGSTNQTRYYPQGNGQIVSNSLYQQGITPSASFGLHYSSALYGPAGSLVWGGYDKSRAIGDVGSFQFQGGDQLMQPKLIGIQLGVQNGSSPFPILQNQSTSDAGLLHTSNPQMQWQQSVVNPALPYLHLTPETCQNIAQYLPVTLNRDKAIYLWNTSDPQYNKIVNSPAFLAMTFQPDGSDPANSGTVANLTIKIPFKLLILTLESPIVDTPVPYFPCSPFNVTNQTAGVFLGRPLLQATFLAANLNTSTFFLAQAPGPDADPPNIQSMDVWQSTLNTQPSSKFEESWAKHWTPLTDQSKQNAPITAAGSPSQHSSSGTHQALSKDAIAGISIGSIVAGAALTVAVLFLLLRIKQKRGSKDGKTELAATEIARPEKYVGPPIEKSAHLSLAEAKGTMMHEMPAVPPLDQEEARGVRAELPGDGADEGEKPLPELPWTWVGK